MITQIENKEQYEQALARIYNLMQMDNPVATALLDELKALSILVEKYEKEHYPMLKPWFKAESKNFPVWTLRFIFASNQANGQSDCGNWDPISGI